MQFKRVLPISDNLVAGKKPSYQNRTPAAIQKQTVQAFEVSGLKQVQFCEQHDIPYSTFANWWRRHRSDQAAISKSLVHDGSMITINQEEGAIKENQATLHMTCALPNRLNIMLSSIVLADLPKLIEVLSTCKLN